MEAEDEPPVHCYTRRSKIVSNDSSDAVNAMSQELEAFDLSSVDSDSEGLESADETESVGKKTLSPEDAVIYSKVVETIEVGGDLKKLKVDHLKAYLRHHRLRLVGVKAVLLERIHEHLEVKDGGGEAKYPRSSFAIECTGDVVLGDVVLFEQKVYDSFDVVSRSSCGPPLGRRWVAGRVVNESYGAGKQQHTFTIEVLWSSGVRPFNALHPLLIKGRNLYRLRTLRQAWSNPEERSKAQEEKHERGAKARSTRAAAKADRLSRALGSSSRRSESRSTFIKQRTSEKAPDYLGQNFPPKIQQTMPVLTLPLQKQNAQKFRKADSTYAPSSQSPAVPQHSFSAKPSQERGILHMHILPSPSYGVLPQSLGVLSAQPQIVQQISTDDSPQHFSNAPGSNLLTQPFLPQEIPGHQRRDLHVHNPHMGLLSLPPQNAQSPGMVGAPNGLASRPSRALQQSLQENPHQEKVYVQRQKSPIESNRGILSGSHDQSYISGAPRSTILRGYHQGVGFQSNVQAPRVFSQNLHRSMNSVSYLPSHHPRHDLPPGAKPCLTEGCQNAGARHCVLKSCYQCCKSARAVCTRHTYV